MLRITVLEDCRCFKKGEIFEFTESTLIVGSNGSGKSTLLRAIRGHFGYKFGDTDPEDFHKHNWDSSFDDNQKLAKSFLIETNLESGIFFDAVLDDPEKQTIDATSYISSGGYGLRHKSHGQAVNSQLRRTLSTWSQVKGKLVALDEFDCGFSIDSQIQSLKLLKNLPLYAGLVLIVSHNYLVITKCDYPIFCMDTRRLITRNMLEFRIRLLCSGALDEIN